MSPKVNAQVHTVLVAEDEPLIRMVAAEVLAEAGFRVIEAGHAADALAELDALDGDLLLLFTDIHMPGSLDGLDLAHHVRRSWPWVGLLVASAQAEPPALDDLPEGCRFLAKPYDPDHVVAHARKLAAT